MGGAAHRVGTLRFRLRAADVGTWEAASAGIRDRFEAEVAAALEDAFDAVDAPGTLLRLDRLHVRLGRFDPQAPGLRAALGRALAAALVPALAGELVAGDPVPPGTAAAVDDDLRAFLMSGVLRLPEPGAALDALIAALVGRPAPALAISAGRLVAALEGPAAATRFLLQLPVRTLHRLFSALAGLPVPAAAPAGAETYLSPTEAAALLPLLTALARSAGAPPLAAALAGAVTAPAALAPALAGAPAAEMPPDDPEPRGAPPEAERAPRPLPVTAAGAILLHPFLAPFFDALGLLEEGRFRDASARQRAVLLGHALATGDTAPAEPDCLLMKLLCGLPAEAPLPRATTIGSAERDEADRLLTAVVRHWGRLGTTTPEGLRDGFLRRPGTLRHAPGGPVLSVAPSGIDVLLDGLPWTISRVRTPFMDCLLAVEWG